MFPPSSIDASQHLWDTFGHYETEVSAGWIVRFCQERNGDTWKPFRHGDFLAYYQKKRMAAINRQQEKRSRELKTEFIPLVTCHESFNYNNLIYQGWVKLLNVGAQEQALSTVQCRHDTLIEVTPDFVRRCMSA